MSEYSIGDFILTGGEIPALIMIDSIVRLIPGTLNNLESANTDSHTDELLDNPTTLNQGESLVLMFPRYY